ncbi:hypothetical protein M3N55_16380 [Roseibaca sp. V10]|uniref:UDP-2,4-diacetamido-2,4, 6-trideoxy-beta-L-altropyranose hydrolase n=1 Tax=Roseinatronobacter domitianus TaxID=2940293 RepID=A0ABT0M609_9RHOB|nr:hypothetical protein [Roseibaca domitiana]MCL1630291.1 hypothetical protein [Roseibaca domitiana]
MSLGTPDRNLPVLFHVQAGARVGMGHLARSSALMAGLQAKGVACRLSLDADAAGHSFAQERGLDATATLDDPCAALVIDALALPATTRDAAGHIFPRLLISPVCADADIATHVMLRDMPPGLAGQLAPNTQVLTNPDFAFVTAQGLARRALGFEDLRIGLCLSGGVDAMALDPLVKMLAGLPHVTRLTVIDTRRPVRADDPDGRVVHLKPGPAPWHGLRDINLFIGGDGVMLAEAIAQAIPAISLTTADRLPKNAALMATGALACVLRGPEMDAELTKHIRDLTALEKMHDKAWHLDGPSRATALARAVITTLHDTPKVYAP